MLHLDHNRSQQHLAWQNCQLFWWFCQGSWYIEWQLMLTMFKISLAANELYSSLDSYDLAKSSRCGSTPRSLLWTNIQALSCGLSKQTSCQARRLNHRCRLFSDTVCRSRPDVWLSCRTGTSFPAVKVLYLKMAIKAVLATKKLGEHLRRDAQHMRVTGEERWTSRAAERQMVGALELNEMLEGRRDFHVVLCVPAVCPSVSVHHQDTSTVPHQGFMLQSIARAFTKGERDKNRATVASRRLLKEGETDA